MRFLLITVFIDMLGLGIIVPIEPALMAELTGRPADAARWAGLIGSSYGLLQFLTAPLLGRLADRYGRRPVLLASLTLLGIDYLGHAVTPTVALLLLFHGLAGAFAGNQIVVNAYLADVTPPGQRARAYGLVGAAFSVGFVAGPTIGGLLGAVDVRLPYFAAAALALGNVAYGCLILPESRPGDRTTPLSLRSANPVAALAAVLRRPVLGRLTLARFSADLSRNVHQAIWTFFVTVQFGWSTAHLGLTMAAGALAGAVFQARAIGPVVRVLGDRRAAIAGGLVGLVSVGATAFATSPIMIYVLLGVGVFGSVGGAAMQSWISRETGAHEQGTVSGALTGGAALAEMVVPVTAGVAFGWSLSFGWPGAVLLVAAACTAASVLLLATVKGAAGTGAAVQGWPRVDAT
jgi:MFS transporter, DHA1 family, tetracycline resistance protein